jgi:hypothetical protein
MAFFKKWVVDRALGKLLAYASHLPKILLIGRGATTLEEISCHR